MATYSIMVQSLYMESETITWNIQGLPIYAPETFHKVGNTDVKIFTLDIPDDQQTLKVVATPYAQPQEQTVFTRSGKTWVSDLGDSYKGCLSAGMMGTQFLLLYQPYTFG